LRDQVEGGAERRCCAVIWITEHRALQRLGGAITSNKVGWLVPLEIVADVTTAALFFT
jgi:hypothetical protein